jgi:hypothetical protein
MCVKKRVKLTTHLHLLFTPKTHENLTPLPRRSPFHEHHFAFVSIKSAYKHTVLIAKQQDTIT